MPMTARQLDAALRLIGWSNLHLAGELDCSENLVRKWKKGETPVPEAVGEWLGALAAAHRARPVPRDWRTASA